jgi:AraC-like DNA-binding protein
MNRALEKLKTGARVYEVAYDLGYSSSYAFSKAFKKHFGLSPEKYLVTLK